MLKETTPDGSLALLAEVTAEGAPMRVVRLPRA